MYQLVQLWQKQWFRYAACVVAGALATTLVYPSVSKHEEQMENIKKQYEQKLQETSAKSQEEKQQLESQYQSEMDAFKSESAKKQEELSKRVNSLVQENSSLKRKVNTTIVEKISPDGTIERRTVSEETLETVTEKVAEVKEELQKKMQEETSKLEKQHQEQLTEVKSSYESKLAESSSKLERTETLLAEERSRSETLEKNKRNLGVGVGYNSDKLYKVHGHYTFWGPVFVGGHVDSNGSDSNRAALSLGINF